MPFDRGLNRTDLVIDLHDADQPGVGGDILPGVALAVIGHVQFVAVPDRARRVEHGGVLDRGDGDRAARAATPDGEIERLGRAAGEDHAAAGGEQFRHPLARDFDRGLGLAAHAMGAVRIAEAGTARPVQPAQHFVPRR